jgi:hypothetical protein
MWLCMLDAAVTCHMLVNLLLKLLTLECLPSQRIVKYVMLELSAV